MDVLSADIEYVNSGNIINDMRSIVENYQIAAYRTVNLILIKRNWLLGKRITEEVLNGENRAEYGIEIINQLAQVLSKEFGKGFDKTNLYRYMRFYKCYPEIVDTMCQQSQIILSWSHYRVLMSVEDSNARLWYEHEARLQKWSVRTLQRNVETQYYYRLLSSQKRI